MGFTATAAKRSFSIFTISKLFGVNPSRVSRRARRVLASRNDLPGVLAHLSGQEARNAFLLDAVPRAGETRPPKLLPRDDFVIAAIERRRGQRFNANLAGRLDVGLRGDQVVA